MLRWKFIWLYCWVEFAVIIYTVYLCTHYWNAFDFVSGLGNSMKIDCYQYLYTNMLIHLFTLYMGKY